MVIEQSVLVNGIAVRGPSTLHCPDDKGVCDACGAAGKAYTEDPAFNRQRLCRNCHAARSSEFMANLRLAQQSQSVFTAAAQRVVSTFMRTCVRCGQSHTKWTDDASSYGECKPCNLWMIWNN